MQSFSAEKKQFLDGGGEMGQLMRLKDWSKTPVGDPDSWPQSLRTSISIILNSKFPMFLFWGPDLVCFYNDAYRPSLGKEGKHPHILGGKAEEYWYEIWPTIKPLIDQVLDCGEATWSENQLIPIYRNGQLEDVYWTFSYSPVHDESGKPAGVFVTCVETTEAVLNSKKLVESKEQLQFAIESAELGTWDYNPYSNKFTSNDRLKEWFGLPAQTEIELSDAVNIMAEKDRTRITKAIERALNYESGGVYAVEYSIIHPVTKKERIVQARGRAWFNDEQVAYRFNGILQDVTEQSIARRKIEESELRFRTMAESAEILIAVADETSNVTYFNKAWVDFTGRPLEALMKFGWADLIHPDDRDNYVHTYLAAFEKKEAFNGEFRILNKDGIYRWIFAKVPPRFSINGDFEGYISSAIDITERKEAENALKQSEAEFRNLAGTLPELVWTTDPKGNQLYASERWKEFTGLEPSDEKTFAAMTHPDDLDNVVKVWMESLKTGKPYKTELRIRNKDGSYSWFYANANPVFNKEGEIEKWVGAFTNINDQKIAENNLKIALQKIEESENRFQKIADTAPVLIRITNTEKLTTYFNKAWLQFRGRKLEEELNNGWREGLHPDDVQKVDDAYNQTFDQHKEFYIEYRLKRYDGEYRWISHHGAPRFTSDGTFEGYIGACMDIHEEIMYKGHLEASEEKLNIVIDASELGTWELDLQTKELTYSDRYLEILGYDSRKKMSHAEILTHLHPDDFPIREKAFKIAVETGSLYYQSRVIWKDGSVHWFEAKGKVFFNEAGKPVKMIGTLQDITEETKYNRELEEREQKFRILADFMPQFVWTGDAQGNLNYFNQAVYDYSGLPVKKLEADGWLQIVHPDEHEENTKAWIESVTHGTDFIFEHRFKRHDGQYRWQLSRAIPQRDAAGNIQMWIGTSTDIQDIKEQEQQKDYFISMASHELKTPITSIKGYVQILQSMYSKGEDAFLLSSLKVVDKQIVTLTKLISELLDISKIKSDGLDFVREDLEINELIRDTVEEIKHINPSHDIKVTAKGQVHVNADRHRIAQVLINFLTNAVKYAPNSKTIQVKSVIVNKHVIVSVEDQGIGINKKDQERIFERFYRVEGKNEKTFPGFGIGLFIASEIIKKHKGMINVESEPGKGSTFSFSLPINV